MAEFSVGKIISNLRKKKGWTQVELARKLNVTDKAVSKWENDTGYPEITYFPELAKLFGVSIDYLMTGIEPTKKVILTSKIHYCAENDDPSMLANIEDLSVRDENGDTLFKLILKYESVNVFNELIKTKRTWGLPRFRFGPPSEDLIYMCLITNNIDKLSLFEAKDISIVEQKEWSEKLLATLFTDKRVNENTFNYIFTGHKRRPSEVNGKLTYVPVSTYQAYFEITNWQTMYPVFLEYTVSHELLDKAAKIIAVLKEINSAVVAELSAWVKDNPRESPLRFMFKSDSYFIKYHPHDYIYAVAIPKKTIDSLLYNHHFELLEQCIEVNKLVESYVPTEKEIQIEKMKADKNVSEAEIFQFSCMKNGILSIAELKKGKDLALIKKMLYELPIHEYEIAKKLLQEKNYKKLYEFAFDYPGYFNICTLLINQEYSKLEEAVKKAARVRGINGSYIEIGYKDDLETVLSQVRKKIIDELTLKYDTEKVVGELTSAYFDKLFASGSYDMIVIKLCVRLEAILRGDYHYHGTFEEMLSEYCNTFSRYDDYDNDYDPETPRLLEKLRMCRNGIVHSDPARVKMTPKELKYCAAHILSIGKKVGGLI